MTSTWKSFVGPSAPSRSRDINRTTHQLSMTPSNPLASTIVTSTVHQNPRGPRGSQPPRTVPTMTTGSYSNSNNIMSSNLISRGIHSRHPSRPWLIRDVARYQLLLAESSDRETLPTSSLVPNQTFMVSGTQQP